MKRDLSLKVHPSILHVRIVHVTPRKIGVVQLRNSSLKPYPMISKVQGSFNALIDICHSVATRLTRHTHIESQGVKRLTIVQFGDYAEAV